MSKQRRSNTVNKRPSKKRKIISTLYDDVLLNMAYFCELDALFNMHLVSKNWNEVLDRSIFWQRYYGNVYCKGVMPILVDGEMGDLKKLFSERFSAYQQSYRGKGLLETTGALRFLPSKLDDEEKHYFYTNEAPLCSSLLVGFAKIMNAQNRIRSILIEEFEWCDPFRILVDQFVSEGSFAFYGLRSNVLVAFLCIKSESRVEMHANGIPLDNSEMLACLHAQLEIPSTVHLDEFQSMLEQIAHMLLFDKVEHALLSEKNRVAQFFMRMISNMPSSFELFVQAETEFAMRIQKTDDPDMEEVWDSFSDSDFDRYEVALTNQETELQKAWQAMEKPKTAFQHYMKETVTEIPNRFVHTSIVQQWHELLNKAPYEKLEQDDMHLLEQKCQAVEYKHLDEFVQKTKARNVKRAIWTYSETN